MKRIGVLAVLICLMTAGTALAQPDEEFIGLGLQSWFPDASGTFTSDAAGTPGTKFKASTLGIDDPDNGVGQVDFWIKPPTWPVKFFLWLYAGEFEDFAVLTGGETMGGTTFLAGSAIARVVLRSYTLGVEWEPPAFSEIGEDLSLTLIGGLTYTSHDLKISQLPLDVNRSVRTLTPVVGSRLVWDVYNQAKLEFMLAISPSIEISDREYSQLDFHVEFQWIFSDNFKLGLGYRFLDIKGEDAASSPNVDEIDWEIDGFYANMVLLF